MEEKMISPLSCFPNTEEFKSLPNLNIPQKKLLIDIIGVSGILEQLCVIISKNNNGSKPRDLYDIRSYIRCQDSFYTSILYYCHFDNLNENTLLVFDEDIHVATISYEEENKDSLI